jgi:hypothetical protein
MFSEMAADTTCKRQRRSSLSCLLINVQLSKIRRFTPAAVATAGRDSVQQPGSQSCWNSVGNSQNVAFHPQLCSSSAAAAACRDGVQQPGSQPCYIKLAGSAGTSYITMRTEGATPWHCYALHPLQKMVFLMSDCTGRAPPRVMYELRLHQIHQSIMLMMNTRV